MQDSAGDRYKSDSDLALKAEPCPDDSARWESFVSSVRSIPVLAQSVYRLSNLLMVPPVDLAAITRVACTDLGLAAQLLKLVNSGISDVPVHDLDYAVVQLGVDPLRAFILSVPVLPSDGALPVLGLWEHAVQCGEVCAWLARKAHYEHQNRAYIAGLLHDLGRFPLIAWQLATNHGELKHSMKLVYATPEQEDERFGINHQVIGGWMAEPGISPIFSWRLWSGIICAHRRATFLCNWFGRQMLLQSWRQPCFPNRASRSVITDHLSRERTETSR